MKKSLLFTIVMALLCLFGNVKAQTTPITVTVGGQQFTLPQDKTVCIWVGGSSNGNYWSSPDNWIYGNGRSLHGLTSNDLPTQNTDVYIPYSSTNNYPIVDISDAECRNIFLAAGAMIGAQYNLTVSGKWYTDIVIPANRYVLLSSPLKETYMGDFFTATQGGTYTGPFASSAYNGTDGNEGNNRKFPYSIYQRLFSNTTTITYDAYDVVKFYPEWTAPTNVMNYPYQVGEGFQVLARASQSSEMADFHFPSNEAGYYYYDNYGVQKDNDYESTTRSQSSGKPAYDKENLTVKLSRNNPNNTKYNVWAVGNPAFATLKIDEFIRYNYALGNIGRYMYVHVPSQAGTPSTANGEDKIYYWNGSSLVWVQSTNETTGPEVTEPYINRDHGFYVTQGTGKTNLIVPELEGAYNMTITTPTMHWDVNGGRNRDYSNTSNHTLSINKTNDPYKVAISGFAGMGVAEGFIQTHNAKTGTITLTAGQQVGSIGDDDGWISNATNPNGALRLYGQSSNPYSTTNVTFNNVRSIWFSWTVEAQKVTNVSKTQPVTLNYTIQDDGSVTLSCPAPFAIYAEDDYYTGNLAVFAYGIGSFYSSTWNYYNQYNGTKAASTNTDNENNDSSTGSNELSLLFSPAMFTTQAVNTTQQNSPRRSAAHGGNMASIIANTNNKTINTFLSRSNDAANEYDSNEDAAIIGDFDESVFSLGTLAGTTVVAVNAINDTTRCQIVLTGVNGDVDLVFDNLDALGENVRLFDANDSTFTALNGNHATTTVTFGVNDSPLRYSLVWDYTPIIAGNETLTAIDFTAFSPAKGEVKVMSNELLKGVRVYNAAGQLITSNNANANEVSFSNLLSGIYLIEAYTANGKATKKVDVK